MMLSLLISTTCMACSDNSIQVNLEKANSLFLITKKRAFILSLIVLKIRKKYCLRQSKGSQKRQAKNLQEKNILKKNIESY